MARRQQVNTNIGAESLNVTAQPVSMPAAVDSSSFLNELGAAAGAISGVFNTLGDISRTETKRELQDEATQKRINQEKVAEIRTNISLTRQKEEKERATEVRQQSLRKSVETENTKLAKEQKIKVQEAAVRSLIGMDPSHIPSYMDTLKGDARSAVANRVANLALAQADREAEVYLQENASNPIALANGSKKHNELLNEALSNYGIKQGDITDKEFATKTLASYGEVYNGIVDKAVELRDANNKAFFEEEMQDVKLTTISALLSKDKTSFKDRPSNDAKLIIQKGGTSTDVLNYAKDVASVIEDRVKEGSLGREEALKHLEEITRIKVTNNDADHFSKIRSQISTHSNVSEQANNKVTRDFSSLLTTLRASDSLEVLETNEGYLNDFINTHYTGSQLVNAQKTISSSAGTASANILARSDLVTQLSRDVTEGNMLEVISAPEDIYSELIWHGYENLNLTSLENDDRHNVRTLITSINDAGRVPENFYDFMQGMRIDSPESFRGASATLSTMKIIAPELYKNTVLKSDKLRDVQIVTSIGAKLGYSDEALHETYQRIQEGSSPELVKASKDIVNTAMFTIDNEGLILKTGESFFGLVDHESKVKMIPQNRAVLKQHLNAVSRLFPTLDANELVREVKDNILDRYKVVNGVLTGKYNGINTLDDAELAETDEVNDIFLDQHLALNLPDNKMVKQQRESFKERYSKFRYIPSEDGKHYTLHGFDENETSSPLVLFAGRNAGRLMTIPADVYGKALNAYKTQLSMEQKEKQNSLPEVDLRSF